MTTRTELERFALLAGRQYAAARRLTLVQAFDDSLQGDLARLDMRKMLRRIFPLAAPQVVESAIQDLLTP